MDVATITMPRELARTKLAEYRRALGRKTSEEYARAAAAYEQLALGRPVLVLSQVFAEVPRDQKGRPRVAIARADRIQIRYIARGDVEQFDASITQSSGRVGRDYIIDVPWSTTQGPRPATWTDGYSLVPMVPPDVARGQDLSRRFILWEVEAWADRRLGVQPDRDPYLLVRIAPDCYGVVAEWDLTEVERAVMRGRVR